MNNSISMADASCRRPLGFPLYRIICRWIVLDAMVLGRVCFHIENAGMGGMGWEGKGCHGMGVGLGRGTPCGKIGKQRVFHQQIIPRHHCGALLASAGQLVAPLGLLFALLFITWGGAGAFLGQSSKQIRKPNEHFSQYGCQKGCLIKSFVG